MATAECIASANDLLAAHSALVNRVRLSQKTRRRQLRALPSPPQAALSVSLIPSPQPSPPASRSTSPSLPPKPQPYRADLPPAKRARLARYDNYVPEEETIRNDYSQRYVDGGEWPQDWVLGADPDHRFEEYVSRLNLVREFIAKCRRPVRSSTRPVRFRCWEFLVSLSRSSHHRYRLAFMTGWMRLVSCLASAEEAC